ncbi:hypothetical protein L484_015882 [Morus notabilis]|uniref:Pre-mRNA-splicing factor SLU7 n=1 Tax=Morus notabilis TaxID=981085 RepID=W9QPM0_9ROSA|nr:hypothetical protein L484_015882 [Morus notabilis]
MMPGIIKFWLEFSTMPISASSKQSKSPTSPPMTQRVARTFAASVAPLLEKARPRVGQGIVLFHDKHTRAFKSMKDQIELEEEINPHIPTMSPLHLGGVSNPIDLFAYQSLKHQRKRKPDSNCIKSSYDIGVKTFQADKYRKGACEKPRKVGAKWTNKHIAPDEKVETFELDYDGKHDRWNGYDVSAYALVIERYEERDEGRRQYQKEQLEKLVDDDDLRVDEARVHENKQMDFDKVEKRVHTTGGGSTGTINVPFPWACRNLRNREDTAKYLLNLDVNSVHYDPKTRSMQKDPLPDAERNEKFYGGDNQCRNSGQGLEFKQLKIHAWESFEK